MRDIVIEEKFYQELKENIDTNLIFADIEVLEYYQKGYLEYLKIELPFTTTGNILTYTYNKKTGKLSLIDAIIYVMDNDSDKEPYIDNATIMKLYDYCRNIFYKENPTYDPKISKIFEIMTKGLPLDDETLNLYSFSKEDIKRLVDLSILVKTESNEYNISLIKELYNYGVKLSLNHKHLNAERCFKKCYESDPNNRDYCLQILLSIIKRKKYKDALAMFSHIETLNPENYQNENTLYLYLLNMLTDCGDKYRDQIENFDPDDLIRKNSNMGLSIEDFEIRKAIIINKFKYAFKLLNEKIRITNEYHINEEVLRELLSQTVDKEEYYKHKLEKSINENKYYEIISLLKEKSNHRYLNSREIYIQLLTEALISITETKTIPIPTITSTRFLYDAIKRNNFKLAKDLNNQFLESTGRNPEYDLLNILLTKINDAILEIKLEITEENLETESSQEDLDNQNLSNEITEEPVENKQEEVIVSEEASTNNLEKELSFAEDIAYYIKAENMTIEAARKKLGIIPSQILLIKLIYAKDYFTEGMDELGNKLLKEVEKSKDKTEEVKIFLNEVRTNKKFYKNRNDSYTRKKVM